MMFQSSLLNTPTPRKLTTSSTAPRLILPVTSSPYKRKVHNISDIIKEDGCVKLEHFITEVGRDFMGIMKCKFDSVFQLCNDRNVHNANCIGEIMSTGLRYCTFVGTYCNSVLFSQ